MSLCLLLICVPILSYVFVAIEVAEITEGFSIHPKEGELIMPLNISTMDLKEIILHVIKTFSLNSGCSTKYCNNVFRRRSLFSLSKQKK